MSGLRQNDREPAAFLHACDIARQQQHGGGRGFDDGRAGYLLRRRELVEAVDGKLRPTALQQRASCADRIGGTRGAGRHDRQRREQAGRGGGGTGTLRYRGRSYPFSIAGLGVGGVGASSVEATGQVYNMPDISRFPGAYAQARYGFALGQASSGELWLQNDAGVIMRLNARREGLMLSLGGDAMMISMR